ncbi:MAG: phosphodiester glycosidase family protein [Acidobacteriota bacterium]|nr:phosphodiester glycosidase family protein [Acidobacteriota bacterium]
MKKIFVFIGIHLWAVFLLVSVSAQDFKTVRDGIEYAEMTRGTREEPVHINLLKLDLTKVRLDVVHAMDAAIGLEKTSSIAARHGAFAAINAGFFRLDRSIFAGDETGVLKIDGKLLSESYANRTALGIINGKEKTETTFGQLALSESVKIKNRTFEISGINRQRGNDELIKYTPEFHRTTLTAPNGIEVVVRNERIVQIFESRGSAPIPPDGFVLSASGKMRDEISRLSRVGQKMEIYRRQDFQFISHSPDTTDAGIFFGKAEDIVGGVPQLIRNGKIEITWELEKSSKAFVETRHPRTAAAKLKDGKFLMVTVDGRQPGYSVGMNLNELAALLLELGATDAMNLDGGGSTTMFLDGKVVNKPSDKEGERSVGDAILVFPRKRS